MGTVFKNIPKKGIHVLDFLLKSFRKINYVLFLEDLLSHLIKPNSRFEFLDSLRGIAALLVALMHFQTLINERSSYGFPPLINEIFLNGHVGVNVFFVLSGFVIAYSIHDQLITLSLLAASASDVLIRLDPPYWVALLLMTGLIAIGPMFFW